MLNAENKISRDEWVFKRKKLEEEQYSLRKLKFPKWVWRSFYFIYFLSETLLKLTKYYQKGKKNALDVKITRQELFYDNLPKSFDGYTIMHLSDLHIDKLYEVENSIINIVENLYCDICVVTGDYRNGLFDNEERLYESLENIFKHIKTKDGILATMGNHDTHEMINSLEKTGVKLLLNESFDVFRGKENISFTGVDDPHFYYSEDIAKAIKDSKGYFKILLVHTSELYKLAFEQDYNLYLCGHTHGGQICKEDGNAIIINVRKGKKYNKGLWKYKDIYGYTSRGTGVSAMGVRFNSFSEIALITLRRKG